MGSKRTGRDRDPVDEEEIARMWTSSTVYKGVVAPTAPFTGGCASLEKREKEERYDKGRKKEKNKEHEEIRVTTHLR